MEANFGPYSCCVRRRGRDFNQSLGSLKALPLQNVHHPSPAPCKVSLFFYFQVVYFLNFIIIIIFYFTILYWFCHTSTCICHGSTHVPHPKAPSHLPPHPILQGHPSIPALSTLSHALNLGWWSISHCYSLKSSHPHSHRVQKSVLYICVSFAVSHIGSLLPSF